MDKPHWYYLLSVVIAVIFVIIEHSSGQSHFISTNEDAILINDGKIKRVDYLTAVTMMKDEKKQPMKTIDYQLIVDRLTEEELLFQYGLEQGIIYQPEISQVIVSNILETIVVQYSSEQYSDEKLYKIYQDKVIAHYEKDGVPAEMAFDLVKDDLAAALREIERSKAVREYIDWLRKRSNISNPNFTKQGS